MTQEWYCCKCIGLPGYEVNSVGEVRSVDRWLPRSDTGTLVFYKGKVLKSRLDKYGYKEIDFSINSVKISERVHRVVAKALLPNPLNLPFVNHKNGVKDDNSLTNLEWCTASENVQHAIDTGLLSVKFGDKANKFSGSVLAIKDGKIVATMSGNREMLDNGFDYRLVSACLMGKRKSHRGCTFIKQTKGLS